MKLTHLVIVALSILGIATTSATSLFAAAPQHTPSQISVIVSPHPDDESEVWSLVENSSANYKIFAYMTRGEETIYCTQNGFNIGFNPQFGEVSPGPNPIDKRTEQCKKNRMISSLNFLNMMSTKDSTIPGKFNGNSYTDITLPLNGFNPEHEDLGVHIQDSSVRVYTPSNNMGMVLFFNLGDGDLKKDEVTWAIQSIMQNREELGIPNLPFYNALGGFANSGYNNCTIYSHPDHKAVHKALYSVNFGFTGYQSGATCATDPDTKRTVSVSNTSWQNAWGVAPGTFARTGYAQKYYGWLDSGWAGWTNATGDSQVAKHPFMQKQSFWQRF